MPPSLHDSLLHRSYLLKTIVCTLRIKNVSAFKKTNRSNKDLKVLLLRHFFIEPSLVLYYCRSALASLTSFIHDLCATRKKLHVAPGAQNCSKSLRLDTTLANKCHVISTGLEQFLKNFYSRAHSSYATSFQSSIKVLQGLKYVIQSHYTCNRTVSRYIILRNFYSYTLLMYVA